MDRQCPFWNARRNLPKGAGCPVVRSHNVFTRGSIWSRMNRPRKMHGQRDGRLPWGVVFMAEAHEEARVSSRHHPGRRNRYGGTSCGHKAYQLGTQDARPSLGVELAPPKWHFRTPPEPQQMMRASLGETFPSCGREANGVRLLRTSKADPTAIGSRNVLPTVYRSYGTHRPP